MFDNMRGIPQVRQVPGSVPPKPSLRASPVQERSRRRHDAIVSAAAESFASVGFDGTTMEAIAAGASTSIGSVYRFFPDKRALFRAVARLALERVQALVLGVLARASPRVDWRVLLDEAIDSLALLHRDDPAVRAIMANLHLYGEYAEEDAAKTRTFIGGTAGVFSFWAANLPPERLRAVATMVVQTISASFVFGQREDPDFASDLLIELKQMLRRYLEPLVAG